MTQPNNPMRQMQRIEDTAKPIHGLLLIARDQFSKGDRAIAATTARQVFPIALWIAASRMTGPIKPKHHRKLMAFVTAMSDGNLIPADQSAQLAQAVALLNPESFVADDAGEVIAAGLMILEVTESKGCKNRREKALAKTKPQPAKTSRKPFGRLAQAAAGLFTANASS